MGELEACGDCFATGGVSVRADVLVFGSKEEGGESRRQRPDLVEGVGENVVCLGRELADAAGRRGADEGREELRAHGERGISLEAVELSAQIVWRGNTATTCGDKGRPEEVWGRVGTKVRVHLLALLVVPLLVCLAC